MQPESSNQQFGGPVRRHARRPAKFEFSGVSAEDGFHAVAHDLSEEGMAFQTGLRFERGERLQIVVPLPQSSDSLRVLCEVRHSHSQGAGLTGVQFLQVSEGDRARVLQMVSRELSDVRGEQQKTGS